METTTDKSTAVATRIENGQNVQPDTRSDGGPAAGPPEFCPDGHLAMPRRTTHALDRGFKAHLARLTFSISPAALATDTFTWLAHLALAPGKQLELYERAAMRMLRFMAYVPRSTLPNSAHICFRPSTGDDRFESEDWQKWPFNVIHHGLPHIAIPVAKLEPGARMPAFGLDKA